MAAVNLANVDIIDADGHVLDRDANLRKFIAEPYCRRRGSLLPSDVWDSSMYGKLDTPNPDLATRLRDMDTEHIDISVLFPTGGFSVTQLPEKDYAAAFCRGYNDWIASVCAESPRLKGVALVPFQDVDAAAKETQRAIGELGLAGVTVGTFGMKEHIGQPMYWPSSQSWTMRVRMATERSNRSAWVAPGSEPGTAPIRGRSRSASR